MNKITVFRLQWNADYSKNRENWFCDRTMGLEFRTTLRGEGAAEEAFHITNAPEEILTEEQKIILKDADFKGPCLSVGDIVKVSPIIHGSYTPEYYLCKSQGWEKFEGNVIQLLKHLSW